MRLVSVQKDTWVNGRLYGGYEKGRGQWPRRTPRRLGTNKGGIHVEVYEFKLTRGYRVNPGVGLTRRATAGAEKAAGRRSRKDSGERTGLDGPRGA